MYNDLQIMGVQRSFLDIVKHKGFLNLWINQILVQLSYNSLNFALIIWVFKLTDSNLAVSALVLSVYLPGVLFGLFSGVLIDITDRRKIILLINILMSLLFLSLVFFKESFLAILLITFLINTLGQFYAPAEASAIPLIVKKRDLLSANTLFTSTLFASFLVGFGLAGPLIEHFSIDLVFILGGIILLFGFFLAFRFPRIINRSGREGKLLIRAIRKRDFKSIYGIGALEIRNTLKIIQGKFPVFFALLILAGIQVVIGLLAVLMPAFFEREIRIKVTDASYIIVKIFLQRK